MAIHGGWIPAIFIICVEVAERFSYYGIASNLIMHLTKEMGEGTTGAAKQLNLWRGVSSLFPLLGAFLADSYFGKFNTILVSTIIYLMGLILLTMTTKLGNRKAVFFTALYILSVGEGGHKPCVQTFGADQFDENSSESTEKKKKTKTSSFFNWCFVGIVCGATTATIVVPYVQYKLGWDAGYALTTAVVFVALVLFLIGKRSYRQEPPVGSPFTRIAQVFVATATKCGLSEIRDSRGLCYDDDTITTNSGAPLLAPTNHLRLLNKAMTMDDYDISMKPRNPWRLCSVNQVEQVKSLLRLFPIWVSCLFYTVVIAQQPTYFIKQVATLQPSIGDNFKIPPASFQLVTGMAILTAVISYDRIVVPIARSLTGHPSGITMLQRIGAGIFLASLAMVVAALVESKRVQVAMSRRLMDDPKAAIPMSAWWLVPQYVLIGFSDMMTVVGLQELFYDQVAEDIRSMAAAVQISAIGVGNLASSGVITLVQTSSKKWGSGEGWLGGGNNLNTAHLDSFYWVLAGLSGFGFCVFVLFARGFVYKKIANSSREGDSNLHISA